MQARVVVVGSANVDLVLAVDHVVAPGETLLAAGSTRGAGGKGANQAVAAARDGADVAFLGALGRDADGDLLLAALAADGVDVAGVRRVDRPTGLAVVSVAADGENAIVVVPGANGAVDGAVAADPERMAGARVVLLQLEIPLPAVAAAAAAARAAGAVVVLNAAPAAPLPPALLADVDVLVVNETEAAALADQLGSVPAVVTTLGPRGVVLQRPGEADLAVPAPAVEAVDTTGAGDTFCGVLAAGLARDAPWPDVLARAATAAALAVTAPGAQAAMPTAAATDAALAG